MYIEFIVIQPTYIYYPYREIVDWTGHWTKIEMNMEQK